MKTIQSAKQISTSITLIIIFSFIILSACNKDYKDCSIYRETEWYVNDSLQGLAGITDPWYNVDVSNIWSVDVAGYWHIEYSSPDYWLTLINRKAMFTEEELEGMNKEEWKAVVEDRCVWNRLDQLRFCELIFPRDGDQIYAQYVSGTAYFKVKEKEGCDMLEVNAEAVFIDTTDNNKEYHIIARALYEYDYLGGENYMGSY